MEEMKSTGKSEYRGGNNKMNRLRENIFDNLYSEMGEISYTFL